MTRKHFEALAETIKYLDLSEQDKRHVAEHVGSVCMSFNVEFDRERFYEACGVAS